MESISTLAVRYALRLCIGIVATCSLVVRSNAATFHGLGTLPGGDYSFATALSGDGKVAVGNATVPYQDYGHHHSFRWTEASGMQRLVDVQAQGFIDDTNVVGELRDEALGVSGDGSLIIGMLDNFHPYVWNESSGFQQLPTFGNTNSTSVWPYGISLDGSLVVGENDDGGPSYAICWTNMNGPSALSDDLPFLSTAAAVSDNGLVVTGQVYTNGTVYTYRWTVASGVELLQHDTNTFQMTWPQGMSRDGNVIVGIAYADSYEEMYRWTAETGLVGLGLAPGDIDNRGFGASNDGNTIVGGAGPINFNWDTDTSSALIWRPQWGVRHLQDVLTNDYHLDLNGWQLTSARAVSTDGTVILGNGINPSGQREAWIATIDSAATAASPQLSIHVDNGNCVLMWPTNAVGFSLEQTSDGTLTNWTSVPGSPAAIGTQFAVTNAITTTNTYFRLRQ
jgi:uncharacterized membrane protein